MFQNPLPCKAELNAAGVAGGSLEKVARGSNSAPWNEAASCPRYEFGSFSGSPGPNVAVCTSNEGCDIVNLTVVPSGTVSVSGSIPKNSTPALLAAPSSTVFAGGSVFLSFRAALTALSTCLSTARSSSRFDGIVPPFLTCTLPFIPGCTSQK